MTAANDLAVRRALEAAGVEFIDENGEDRECDYARASNNGVQIDRAAPDCGNSRSTLYFSNVV